MLMRPLGQSGLFVSELCLGTMTFGGGEGLWGQIGQLSQNEADALLKTALDAGINFIDTANIYAGEAGERIVGQALKTLGVAHDEVVIATKVLGPMGDGLNARGARADTFSANARRVLSGSASTTSTSIRFTASMPRRRWSRR
jgi:aryl-alcohol dehydrogenase-like predicted oxidoreductase